MTKLNEMVTNITIEMSGDTKKYMVSAKQGDKATRYVVAKLLNNGALYNIPKEASAVVNLKKPDGKHVYNECSFEGAEVIIELTNQMLAVAGTAYCDIEIRTTDYSQIITSASFTIEIEESVRSDSAILSSNEFTELETKLVDVKTFIDKSKEITAEEEKRVEAERIREENEEARKSSIAQSVEDTENAATAAVEAAGTAATAAVEASSSAETAINSALEAESYAHGNTGIREEENIDNALFYKEQAKTEANRAQQEADRAQAIVNIGNAQQGIPGLVKPDGESTSVDKDGTIHANIGSLKIYTDVSEVGIDMTDGNHIVEIFNAMSENSIIVLNCNGSFGTPITPEDLPADAPNGILTIYKTSNYNYVQMNDWYGGREPSKKVYYNAVLNGWDEENEVDILILGEWYVVGGLDILRGDYDIAIGNGAGNSEITDYSGMQNVAIGGNALNKNEATRNVAIGGAAMVNNISGNYNTAVGDCAMYGNVSGNHNTAVGEHAMYSSESGNYNTAVGKNSGINLTGNYNTAVGNGTMRGRSKEVPNAGERNSAIGNGALVKNSTGNGNVAIGDCAMYENESGNYNTAIGQSALGDNISGTSNIAIGKNSMRLNTTGGGNVAIGAESLNSNISGESNTAIGNSAMKKSDGGSNNISIGGFTGRNISGDRNIAIGEGAMRGEEETPITGTHNIAMGYYALSKNESSEKCVAIGRYAMSNNKSASNSVAIGEQAMMNCEDQGSGVGIGANALKNGGIYCVAVGLNTMNNANHGWHNTAIGAKALQKIQDGGNTAIGAEAMMEVENVRFSSALGYQATVTGSNQIQLGKSDATTYTYGAVQNRSDERDKTDIHDTDLGLDFINRLRPVKFRWDYREAYTEFVDRVDENGEPETVKIKYEKDGSRSGKRYHEGLIAQEVKKVMEEMGVEFAGYQDHSINGGKDVLSIGYTELITPLIKAVQELDAKIEALKSQLV